MSGARTAIHWLVRSTGSCFAHPEALWKGTSVPDSCVTVAHSLGTRKQMERQTEMQGRKRGTRGDNGEETGLWALNVHPTTTSGPNDWHPSGFYRGKQPPPPP